MAHIRGGGQALILGRARAGEPDGKGGFGPRGTGHAEPAILLNYINEFKDLTVNGQNSGTIRPEAWMGVGGMS
jgi:hypothetical protein